MGGGGGERNVGANCPVQPFFSDSETSAQRGQVMSGLHSLGICSASCHWNGWRGKLATKRSDGSGGGWGAHFLDRVLVCVLLSGDSLGRDLSLTDKLETTDLT